jgi:hypothetical protein
MSYENYEVHTWSERDRLHIEITDKRTDKTVAEWWDDDARQMFEDGFFEGGIIPMALGTSKPDTKLEESVLKYADEMGMLSGESFGQVVKATLPKPASTYPVKEFTADVLPRVCEALDLDCSNSAQLLEGINVELEHCDVTGGDLVMTAKIALAHLREDPDYYKKLKDAGL